VAKRKAKRRYSAAISGESAVCEEILQKRDAHEQKIRERKQSGAHSEVYQSNNKKKKNPGPGKTRQIN